MKGENLKRNRILKDTVSDITVSFSDRPTAVVATVFDLNGVSAFSASCTLGGESTISGSWGNSENDRRQIGLNSLSTFFVGATVRLQNAAGQLEFCTLTSLPTSRICSTDTELFYDYATSDTIVNPQITCSIPAIPTHGNNYRLNVVATFATKTETKNIAFDVVDNLPEQAITTANLRRYDSHLHTQLSAENKDNSFDDALSWAWEIVLQDFSDALIKPSSILDSSELQTLHLYKFKQILAEQGILIFPDQTSIEQSNYFRDQYIASLSTTRNNLSWVDSNTDLTPQTFETSVKRRPRVIW